MKAITIHQPWASWIAFGWKTVETRSHRRLQFLVRQRIAIHAGLTWDPNAHTLARVWLTPEQLSVVTEENCVHGAVVATADVVSHVVMWHENEEAALRPWRDDLYALFLGDIEPLDPPVKARGHQGAWEWKR